MGDLPVLAPRQSPCGTCDACCRAYLVPVCGYDIWRISRSHQLSPAQFVVALRQRQPTADGIILRPDGPAFGLALAKRDGFRPGGACVFLIDRAGETARCAIYAQRPVTCVAYPMALRDRQMVLHPDALCPAGAWPEREPARPEWFVAYKSRRWQFDLYARVAASWNAHVTACGDGRHFALGDYYDYLLNAYEALEAASRSLGHGLSDIARHTWHTVPLDQRSDESDLPDDGGWVRYRDQIFELARGGLQ